MPKNRKPPTKRPLSRKMARRAALALWEEIDDGISQNSAPDSYMILKIICQIARAMDFEVEEELILQ